MEFYLTVIVFVFGTLLGSFYNVVGYRLPKGLSIVRPGSFCPKCNHSLKWYELIPILSFVIQRGKCRKCKCNISPFYPLMELLTGILFAASYLLFGFSSEFLIAILISSFLVIVIVSDVNYLVIPDETTIFFSLAIIIIKLIANGIETCIRSILYGMFLFAIMYIIMLIGNRLFKKESLGGGDIKLMFFVGTILSLPNGLFAIFLSSFLALPVSLYTYVKNKNRVIPFGPFILLAALIIFAFDIDVLKLLAYLTK